ncbi:MAG TPA: hypothetical protein VK993_11105 [Chthoniobacterales bacterium]|nr:hypothetical protein [Chthoniobacterales bacterium]
MNEYSQPGFGKISVHGDGMGAPTPELVEKRAREIALIDERNPDEFTDADWEQARAELLGVSTGAAPEETPENAEMTEEWSAVPSDTGRRAGRAGEDDEMLGERLFAGGLEEGMHDSMVQARKDELSQEGGVIEGA